MAKQSTQDYLAKVTRLIPAQIIGAYILIAGLIPTNAQNQKWIYTFIFVFLLVLAPIIGNKNRTQRKQKKLTWKQIVIVGISFSLWVYCLGGPFRLWFPGYYQPWIGSVAVVMWSMLTSFIDKETENPGPFVWIPKKDGEHV
ncbi:hypothetical protein [Candidatus Uabimicrobium sp. HlEnr_7]|uniref:hypothetical protein n=1 Tax=Candidatus Uabimicrobium helgolandensis TaxID=3095367 RepID=UPI003558F792